MTDQIDFYVPSCEEFREGYEKYKRLEKLGPIYFDALRIVSQSWGDPTGVARGVRRIIRGWNVFTVDSILPK